MIDERSRCESVELMNKLDETGNRNKGARVILICFSPLSQFSVVGLVASMLMSYVRYLVTLPVRLYSYPSEEQG